ncbi:MAG: minichromosome maintenance protein MCM [Candidatus Methanofastidiosia archaeon]
MQFDEALSRFKDFLQTYPVVEKAYYLSEIEKCKAQRERSLVVDFEHLLDYDFELSQKLIDDPTFFLPIADGVFEELFKPEEKMDFHTRFKNLTPRKIEIRDLRAEHINKLIQIEGVVRRASEVKPEIVEAVFTCQRCGQIMIVEQDAPFFKAPNICQNPACGRKGPFKLEEDSSKFIDWQNIKVQERPERLRGGQMPRSLDCILRDDIVDLAVPGNRVTIVGKLKGTQEFTFRGKKKTTFRNFIEVNYVEVWEKDIAEIELSEEDRVQIQELSSDPFICDKIINSIAPSIYGLKEIKEAIALLLFSGVRKILPDGTRLRGDSNVLLVGDPGVAKSQILQYVARIALRGIYTSGKGTSAAGLTATVVRDEGTGGWALEAGALVIADLGVACIDEIDKMSKDDRSSIHEAMEQQTVSIAKAGIVATLNARASILAAANPKYGRYDPYRPVTDQIDLPPTLLSRFDLVYVLTDKPEEEQDKRIAEHIVGIHANPEETVVPPIPAELLAKYISYAKSNLFPELSKEARQALVNFYIQMRKSGEAEDSPVPITPRQMEALIRLSEARARMRLSPVVEKEDAEEIIRLFRECLFKVAMDFETGKLDIDTLMTGTRKSQRDRIIQLIDLIQELDKKNNNEGAPEDEVIKIGKERGLKEGFIRENLARFKREGEIYEPRPGFLKVLREY